MITVLVALVFAILGLFGVMIVMGKYAEARLKLLASQEQHAREFFKHSKSLVGAASLTSDQAERLVFLGREIADPRAPRRFCFALATDRNGYTDEVERAKVRRDELDELAKDPEALRAYAEALTSAFLAISYSSWFWGLHLRAKIAEHYDDAPRMTRATKRVAKQVHSLELQAA